MVVNFVFLLLWWAAVKRGAIVGGWRWAWLVSWFAATVIDSFDLMRVIKGLYVAGAVFAASKGLI